jgi:hypothetical protein
MKKCPFCQAENQDEAAVCQVCGRSLLLDAAATDPAPTQQYARARRHPVPRKVGLIRGRSPQGGM